MMEQPQAERAPRKKFTVERTFQATPKELWDLWTTREGLEAWWGPEGFTAKVLKLDIRPGGRFEYEMTAIGPEQVEALQERNIPLVSRAASTFREIKPPRRIAWRTMLDFIPGMAPYEVEAVIDFHPVADGVRLVITQDAMHNDEWTQMSIAGMTSSLDKLERVLEERRKAR